MTRPDWWTDMARPKKDIDPKQVEALASILCTDEEIADVLKCSSDTLTRRFRAELDQGRNMGRASLRRQQWEQAKHGNATMLVWLGKQWLGQRDKTDTEISGAGGGPVEITRVERVIVHD